jgi:hypothetical protein
MKRVFVGSGLLAAAILAVVPVLRADVTTKEKTTFKMEGIMGGMINRAMGGSDGIASTVAVKGNRMAEDQREERPDHRPRRREGLHARHRQEGIHGDDLRRVPPDDGGGEEARAGAGRADVSARQTGRAGRRKQLEFTVDVKETGQTKTLIGHSAREVVLTIAMHEKGKKVEESGGMILTNTLWIAPKIAALDEMYNFQMRYIKALNLGAMIDPQQAGAISAAIPGIGQMGEKLAAERSKLQGTTLSTTSVFETVKSPEAMKQAESQKSSGGGGLGGMLAGKLMKQGPVQARTKALTTTNDTCRSRRRSATPTWRFPRASKKRKSRSTQMTRRGAAQPGDAEEKRSARRRFLKAVPVAVAGAVGTKALAQGPAPAGSVTPTSSIARKRSPASSCTATRKRRSRGRSAIASAPINRCARSRCRRTLNLRSCSSRRCRARSRKARRRPERRSNTRRRR